MKDPDKTIEELERKLRIFCNPTERNANKMAREVVRTLTRFLNNDGKLPQGLLLSIGVNLVDHVASGEQMANDIQELYELIEKSSSDISSEDTVKSVDE